MVFHSISGLHLLLRKKLARWKQRKHFSEHAPLVVTDQIFTHFWTALRIESLSRMTLPDEKMVLNLTA